MIEETKPPVTTVTRKTFGEDEKEQPVTIGNIAIIALIMIPSVPTLLLIGHALPLLDSFFNGMKPLVGYLGFCTGIALFILVGLFVWYVLERFRVDIKRRSIEAATFTVDPQSGNYNAYFDPKQKSFVRPPIGVTVPLVPQTQTYAPHVQFVNKGNMTKGEIAAEPALLEQGKLEKPSVEELASKVERNSLDICLGRSLTKPNEYLIGTLKGRHLKIIGTSQMGKSCEIGAILDQVERTHDPERLQFALLDKEYKLSQFFEKSDHLACLDIGRGNQAPMHAKTLEEVPTYLRYLVEELERRDRLGADVLLKLPHILIYFEEFLDTKNQIKAQGGKVCLQFLTDFTTLATRGLKLGLHVLACTQADYADEDLRDAMVQFTGINIAFSVKPSAAMAAGFLRNDLLKQNFSNRIPGQFVLEMSGVADLVLAPEYDVMAKLEALSQPVSSSNKKTIDLSRESGLQEGRNQLEPALQAIVADLDGEQWEIEQFNWKLDQLKALLHANQNEQYTQIWEVSPGSGREFKKARAERAALIEHVKSLLGSKIA